MYNLIIEQGTSFGLFLNIDLDISGLGIRAEMAKHLHPSSPRIPFQCFIEQPAIDGQIVITMSSDHTTLLTLNVYPLDYLKIEDWDERKAGVSPDEIEFLIPGRNPISGI